MAFLEAWRVMDRTARVKQEWGKMAKSPNIAPTHLPGLLDCHSSKAAAEVLRREASRILDLILEMLLHWKQIADFQFVKVLVQEIST